MIRSDIGEHWNRAIVMDGRSAGYERVRGHDDLVARPDPRGPQREQQSIGGIAGANGMASADVAGNLLFELLDLGLQNEGTPFHDIKHGSKYLLTLLAEHMRVTKEWYFHEVRDSADAFFRGCHQKLSKNTKTEQPRTPPMADK